MSRYSTRPRDFLYLSWVTTQQCVVCEKAHAPQLGRTYAHHAGARGLAQRAPDRTAIPLCWRHHDRAAEHSIHKLGKLFWDFHGLERGAVITELNERFENENGWRQAA